MRILVINYEYPPIGGGGGYVTRDLLEHMAYKGHSVTIITSHFPGLAKQENVNGVDVVRVPIFFRNKLEVASMASMLSYFPSSVLRALLCFNGKSFEIINTHFAIPSGPTGYLLSKVFRLPNILSIHGGDIFDPSKPLSPHKTPILKETVQTMINKADRVVAQSSDTKRNAYAYYNIDRQIDIIPLGIKKPSYERKCRSDFGLDPDEIIFCTIGRLIKRKNINETIAILSELKNRHRFKFLIIGDGPERGKINELAKQHGLGSNIQMIGNVSNELKFELLSLSDIFLSTAFHEGFGLVFLEAMEVGIPIVCYNRGGQNDFLEDGKTGFLVNFGDKKQFKDRVSEIINNKQLRLSIGSYNKKVIKKFYIEVCAEKYISLFDKMISYHSISGNTAVKKL